ncbi:hypothetical protein KGF54_004625 [Candida jiufengensis]|uniref:uncharacterized protein n=1 Tax=Candida jiufengensis TaxID=497108 RepID=UPI00222554CA|nr:uncharacterized protein KGF54_004625 [Candida jiufengensis]KAI5951551.1 hypothetical protein KGF54_004625 [Candida jiufengensis]
MISRKLVFKQIFKNKININPQLSIPILNKFYEPQLFLQQNQQLRSFATFNNEYEIDYISLTKKIKKPSSKKISNASPILNLQEPDNLWYPFEKLYTFNEELTEPLLDYYIWEGNLKDEEGHLQDLAYVKEFYEELLVFQHFLQEAFEYRIKQFSDLNSMEIISTLFIFQDKYSRGEVAEVTELNTSRFDEMTKNFIGFVNEDPLFTQNLSIDLLPQVQKSEQVLEFLENGLFFYIPELKSLDQEFNFKKFRSKTDLLLQIEKMLKKFDEYLQSNSNVDEMFFKISIQVARYKNLKSLLEITSTPLKLIKNIITKNDFSLALDYKSFEDYRDMEIYFDKLEQPVLVWNKLYFANQIPKTKNYFKLAPLLFNIAQVETNPYHEEAKSLFDDLTTDQLKAGKLLPALVYEDLELQNYKFSSNFEDNFTLNFLFKINYPFDKFHSLSDTEWEFYDKTLSSFELNVLNNLEFEKIKEILEQPEVIIKYLELKGHSLSKCFPPYSEIINYVRELKSLRSELGVYFETFASVGDLTDFILLRKDLPDSKLIQAIEDSSKYIGNNLRALDDLVEDYTPDGYSKVGETSAELSSQYKQIPDWLRLENHINEIKFLKQLVGGFEDKAKVMSKVDEVLTDLLSDDTVYPEINHGSFIKLSGKLREFSYNNSTNCLEILNAVVLNNDVFAQFEKSFSQKPTTIEPATSYVQIPDDLQLSNFTKELSKLKESLGGVPFENHDSKKIINTLDYQIDQYFAEQGNDAHLIASNNSEVFQYIRLKRRLARLFDLNGNHTVALDVLLNSQSVFENFEKNKDMVRSSIEYKQIPNDFHLEEYIVELEQLKNALNIDKFEDVYASEILEKVKELSNANYATMEKKIIWNKLYKNLCMLFRHNNDSTFALDNVVTSAKEFGKFQNLVKSGEVNVIEKQLEFLKANEYEILGKFLLDSKLLFKPDIYSISKEEFENIVDENISNLDISSPQYLFRKAVLNQLKNYNSEIDNYPTFIVCLYGMNKNSRGPMTSQAIQEFYNDLKKSLDDKAKDSITHNSTPISNKFDIEQFKPSVSSNVNEKYHDSEKYLSDLNKKQEDVSNFEEFENHFIPPQPEPVKTIQPKVICTKKEHQEPLRHVKVQEKPKSKNPIDTTTPLTANTTTSQLKKEEIGWKEPYEDLPGYKTSYMLLTLDGDSIPISKSLLGNIKLDEDIFQILNNFDKQELLLINEKLNILQFKNWKIIGYKIMDGRKYLILGKDVTGNKKFNRLKDIFSVIGLILVSLIGLNIYWEEPIEYKENQQQEKHQDEPLRVVDNTIIPNVEEFKNINHDDHYIKQDQLNNIKNEFLKDKISKENDNMIKQDTKSSWRKFLWA